MNAVETPKSFGTSGQNRKAVTLHETDCCEYEYDDVLENPCKYAGDNLIEYIMEKISPYDCIVNGYEKLNMRFMCPRFGEKFKYV